jgi:4-oxalocrotonate tautomerase family enzyme
MPIIEAHILEGYSPEDKARLGRGLTDATRLVVPATAEALTVIFHEMPSDNYMRGGQSRTPAPALPDPCAVVRAYLDAMQERDLDGASAMLGAGFTMTFPGAEPMTTLAELIAWSKPRYNFVRKTFDSIEAFQNGDVAVVYTRGTLAGEWPDGSPFAGIRFIDRFELSGGKITRQDVWNDIAEVKGSE